MADVTTTLASLLLLYAVFLPLERLFPAHRHRLLRAGLGTDLLFFLGQYLLWTTPVVAALTFVVQASAALPLQGVREAVAALPLWLQCVLVVALCDLGIYWAHRLSHRSAFLWRFHRVHHTAERLDWLAAYREHPFDNLYTRLVENLPAILLGFPLELLAGFAMFRGLWALYIHSNVALTPGPLRYLIGAPRLHHWHHEVEHRSRVNFANLSPLMDLLFGTFHDPGHMPERYGIPDEASKGYVAQLVEPLLPRRAARGGSSAGRRAERIATSASTSGEAQRSPEATPHRPNLIVAGTSRLRSPSTL